MNITQVFQKKIERLLRRERLDAGCGYPPFAIIAELDGEWEKVGGVQSLKEARHFAKTAPICLIANVVCIARLDDGVNPVREEVER